MRNIKNIFKKKTESNTIYGYREMKKIYNKFLGKGLLFSILFHAALVGTAVYIVNSKPKAAADEIQVRDVVINDIAIPPPPQINTEPEVPEVKEEPKGVRNVPLKKDEALTPVPVKKDISEVKTTSTQKDLNNINAPVSKTGDENASNTSNEPIGDPKGKTEKPAEPPVTEKPIEKVNPNKNYDPYQVERAPQQLNLGAVKASMKYPAIARETNTEGKVTVKVLVGKDGDVVRVGSISGPEVFHDEVATKVMALRFSPAIQNGEAVNCWVTVPFSFTLN